ncbi:MAG: 30S ribosomal protein S8 [Planctomycetes bacterium]|nr:30S ribosomal protein S8 [Planctomycetota bacterium]
MSLSDPIADMLTRIRNAARVKKTSVDVRRSNLCVGIARILKQEGFVEDFKELADDAQGHIRIYLKYSADGAQTLHGLERVSKPGRRVYRGYEEITPLRSGMGVGIFSTSRGILGDRECRARRVGGEYLARVY